MNREEARKYIKSQDPGAFLEEAKETGFICPECGNGSGKKGTGIELYKGNRYHCFSCGFHGDVLDLIGIKFHIEDYNGKLKKGAEIYGITIDDDSFVPGAGLKKKDAGKIINKVVSKSEEDYSGYYEKCHAAVDQTDYFKKRGIGKEIIDRFNLGYDPTYGSNSKWNPAFETAVIFPTSKNSFEARNTMTDPNSEGARHQKTGSTKVFNAAALSEEKPIFVCEGVFDALSIIESGGQAVSIGSGNNIKNLLSELDKVIPNKPLILLLDNDDKGKEYADKLAEELEKRNIPFLKPDLMEFLGDYHDPNDRLMHDRDGLTAAVKKTIKETDSLFPDPQEEARQDYLMTSAGKSVDDFIGRVHEIAERPRLSTGFPAVDDALDGGIYTGLYVIGAISSLGKTTLALQIADNLAEQGRYVLFFSLEQSRYELMSKSVSRETYKYCRCNGLDQRLAKSNLGILDGRRWFDYGENELIVMGSAFKAYRKYAENLFIYEGIGNIRVSEIREKLKRHIQITGNKRPIIFADYLQILQAPEGHERATDKQVVDYNVTALKQLSRDFDIPVIAVSSLNRQSYGDRINMSAFKESGAIEYGSDVLIGLQLTGAGYKGFDVNNAKDEMPRKIDFCILKNRNGRITANGIPMNYYQVFNFFVDAETDKHI